MTSRRAGEPPAGDLLTDDSHVVLSLAGGPIMSGQCARMGLCIVVADLVRVTAHEHTPSGRRVVCFEDNRSIEDGGSELAARRGAEHDISVHDRVIHGEYGELNCKVHADAAEGPATKEQIALGLVDHVKTLARHRASLTDLIAECAPTEDA